MDQKILADLFIRRVEALASKLNDDVEGYCLLSGKEQGSTKPKTKALYVWLFGYDMIETIFIVTKKQIIYLASTKKLQMLDEIKQKIPGKYEVHLIQKQADNKGNFEKIKQIIGDCKLYALLKENQAGQLAQEWNEFNGFNCVDAHEISGTLLAVKDDQEIGFINQSASLTNRLFKKLISIIENAIDIGSKIKHSDLAKKIEEVIEKTDKQKIIKDLNLQDGLFDVSYTPIIQSGGQYNLSLSAESNLQNLSSDVILLNLSTQVNEYNTTCVRTLFINPTELQKKIYTILLDLQIKVIGSLNIGKKINEVYKECKSMFDPKLKELNVTQELPSIFGYGIGLELKEQLLSISEDNEHVIQKNEIYFVQVSLEHIPNGQKGIQYSLSIGDVVLIHQQNNQVLTQSVPKAYKGVSYQLQDDDDEDINNVRETQANSQRPTRPRGPRKQQIEIQREKEKERQKHQQDLAKLKQKELEERLDKDEFVQNTQENKALELEKVQCYPTQDNYPKELQKGQIYIDTSKSSILVPFQNGHIPFHVSCIKNVSKIDEGRIGQSIRINFFTTETSAGQIEFPKIDGQTIFIKELQYRSKKVDRPQNLINQIKQLQKKVKAEQQVEKEKQHVGDMEPLIINKGGRKPIFRDLKIRPTFGQGKGSGTLEVHTNGFRYIHSSKETLDIVFKNIKHYLYQSPEKEIIAAIHFHLYSPIVLGRKKTHDIQFYCEVGGGVEHLEGRKKTNRNDEDEIEEEERLRQQRRKMNKEFEAFIKSIEEVGSDYKIEFEKPIRRDGFEGNWNRARIFIQPTQNTLMSIVESPFFILTIEEVEICCFERIIPGIKSFDLVFVFKNYEKPVLRIESIDVKDQEEVKNWLNKKNLLYFEVGQNLVWKNVLGSIQKDIKGFVQDGGWMNILMESDEEENEEDEMEAGDSEFSPGASGDDEDDDSDYSDEDDVDDDDGDEEFDEDDDDDEEISDVIDLNKISEQEDDDDSDDSEDERRKKPHKQHSSRPQQGIKQTTKPVPHQIPKRVPNKR